jgi:4-hydroxyphenylacetate 3-monooxygenase
VPRPVHDTPVARLPELSGADPPLGEAEIPCGLAHRITEAIGTNAMPPVREQLGFLAANVGMVHGMLAGMETDGTMRNGYWVPNRIRDVFAQVLTQDLYPRVIAILRELAGGALIMLPSSIEDYSDPHLAKIIRTTQRASKMEPDEKVKFMKAAWDAVGSEFGSRHTQYEMFYAGRNSSPLATATAPSTGPARPAWWTN